MVHISHAVPYYVLNVSLHRHAFGSKFDARCHSSFPGAALRGISLLVFFRDGFMVVLRKVYG